MAMLGTEILVRAIQRLGLRVAPEKTEVVAFAGRHHDPLPEGIQLAGAHVPVRRHIKYLGLLVDGQWSFRAHFQAVLEKGERVASSLGRLMPNLHGTGERQRRLYAMVVNSIVLYGAPVWADDLLRCRWGCVALRRLQRTMASRLVCAYRTVSGVVAGMLACTPPFELQAQCLSRAFRATRDPPPGDPFPDVAELRRKARKEMIRQWSARVRDPRLPGAEVRFALGPVLRKWVDRPHRGQLTYRTTQMLAGYGSFGEYLHRIGKARTPKCEHCDAAVDTARHTLAECPAWKAERRALCKVVGPDLSLAVLFRGMATDVVVWDAVVSFSEAVMLAKETAERDREARGRSPVGSAE
ncbi:uncharacterized protein LOC109863178 [Pseudomyrmex gracilis]|uniref:uncharacterized protein LOC109863178 n=1 Tax=Pseudomyrmex gracilis TaxID=219809 RepID=UPI0009952185|nr:uncharacterized protein LOC109863178 [Pseudomyrmex gracilis]